MEHPVTNAPELFTLARPVLINMVDRPERLSDSLAELWAATGSRPVIGRDLHLIRPRRFEERAGFASAAHRSNFEAHLEAARWGRDRQVPALLVLEDDLAFGPRWPELGPRLLAELTGRPWQLATLGYLDVYGEAPTEPDPAEPGPAGPDPAGPVGWARFEGKVNGAHAYLVNGEALDEWVGHLEAVRAGEPGDDILGPMPSDGAMNTFVWADPNRIRLLAVPNLVGTRPTRSDLHPKLVDRIPMVSALAEAARRHRRRRSRAINYA